MFKSPFTIAVALIFVVTGIMAVVGAGTLANIGLETLLGVENCIYEGRPVVDEFVCKSDSNGTKRDIARGLSMFLTSLPVSVFSYFKIKT